MMVVEMDVQSGVSADPLAEQRPPFPLQRVDHRVIPGQQVDVELGGPVQCRAQDIHQAARGMVLVAGAGQGHATVNVPAQNPGLVACLQQQVGKGPVIGLAVNQDTDPLRAVPLPETVRDVVLESAKGGGIWCGIGWGHDLDAPCRVIHGAIKLLTY